MLFPRSQGNWKWSPGGERERREASCFSEEKVLHSAEPRTKLPETRRPSGWIPILGGIESLSVDCVLLIMFK